MSHTHGSDAVPSDERLKVLLSPTSLPRHVAIIMDGNGRWAARRGLPRIAGHRRGIDSAQEAVQTCLELGIPALTLYAFSMENWKRPLEEVGQLMNLVLEFFHAHVERLLQERIRVRAIGRLERLPLEIRKVVQEVEQASRAYDRLTVTIALSYSGRAEIVDAINKLLDEVNSSHDAVLPISEEQFGRYLSLPDVPDPDLLIRTSGECRISNFLLWQIAYAELYFTPVLWPDFRRRDFLLALLDYQRRERRLGGIATGRSYAGFRTQAVSDELDEDHGQPVNGIRIPTKQAEVFVPDASR
ncbi:MAG: di-trans,poly-cis-decaprenylcistransferase [Nitrospirae bacterium]|nr:MAG: di-trans,poly-cis-decaprenylcistransferase [Nitrospirota bacterium]